MKIALVTGGGTGIGRAAAIELNKIDFEVYVIGRREKELKETSSLRTLYTSFLMYLVKKFIPT